MGVESLTEEKKAAKDDSDRMLAEDEKELKAKADVRVKAMREDAERALLKFFGEAEQKLQADLESKIFGDNGAKSKTPAKVDKKPSAASSEDEKSDDEEEEPKKESKKKDSDDEED